MRMIVLCLCGNNISENYLEIDLEKIDYDLTVNIINKLESIVSDIKDDNDNIINISKSKELDNKINSEDLSEICLKVTT